MTLMPQLERHIKPKRIIENISIVADASIMMRLNAAEAAMHLAGQASSAPQYCRAEAIRR